MKKLFRIFGLATQFIERATAIICVVIFIAVVLLNGFEAVSRSLFRSSSIYTVESSVVLISLAYFLGYLVLMNRDEDITLDYFYVRLPLALRRLLDIAIAAGVVLFFVVLTAASFSYTMQVRIFPDPVLPFSESYSVMPILIGSSGCLWVAIYRLLCRIFSPAAPEMQISK